MFAVWRKRSGLLLGVLSFMLLLLGCDHSSPTIPPLLFPALSDRLETLNAISLHGAGNTPLVTLEKQAGVWSVRERGWPVDLGKLNQYLFTLSQARLSDAKTKNTQLYRKLGVEPIAPNDAQSLELRLQGGGPSLRLLIGHEHSNFAGSYIRRNDEAQAWLADRSLAFDRDPAAWLDHALIDLPLARIAQVHIEPIPGHAFTLIHRHDRFVPDDASMSAANSQQGNALAGVLDQLQFEDTAMGGFAKIPERKLHFFTVEGSIIAVSAWRIAGRVWITLSASIDEARLAQWLTQSPDNAARVVGLRKQVEAWNTRFSEHRFLLPNAKAAIFMLSRDQIMKALP